MPARRRHRKPKPRSEPMRQFDPNDEIERGWAKHQQFERERRMPPTLEQQFWRQQQIEDRKRRSEQAWAEILRAKAMVEEDFERWRRLGLVKHP